MKTVTFLPYMPCVSNLLPVLIIRKKLRQTMPGEIKLNLINKTPENISINYLLYVVFIVSFAIFSLCSLKTYTFDDYFFVPL